jgi:flagellar hook-length control protein FliK
MTRFTDDFRGVEASGSTVTIALTPEELGSVSITLTTENNALTAKIVTDNKEAASMLSEQIQQFVDSMAEKGVTVEKTEVVYSQTGQSGQGLGEGRHEADTRDSRENNYFFFSGDERVEAEVSYIGLRDIYESAARYYGEEPAPVDYKA